MYLQNERFEWVEQQGLDSGLRLNPDGTFVLHFPSGSDETTIDNGRIWYVVWVVVVAVAVIVMETLKEDIGWMPTVCM